MASADGQPDRGPVRRPAGPTAEQGRPAPRTTRQRIAVGEMLSAPHDFRSAQEIHAGLRERGESIGLATVYRHLALMVRAGDVDVLAREDGESVYLRCSRQHHHHLVCRSCGHTVEITGPAVERWAGELAARHGYTALSHTLEVFGLCPACSSTRPAAH